MRMLLAVTLLFLLATDVLSWDLTAGTGSGLSAKNGILYVLAVFLLLRMVVARTPLADMRAMYVAFAVLIGYALITWLIAGVLVRYPDYDLVDSAIRLKSGLIDNFIFFVVFFLGIRSSADALFVIKALLLGAVFANVMTVADVAGVIDLGFREREDGRAQGALGESNQYAAFIILLLPALIAAFAGARGLRRVPWLAGVLVSGVALFMTVSRGGLVGLLTAAIIGAFLYGRYLSLGRAAMWTLGGIGLMVLLLSFTQYDQLIQERVFNQTGSIDLSDASSGRSEIWSAAIEKMLSVPVTLLTGFGWNVYWTFPFRYSPHNHYLGLWFNLGLVGLVSGSFVLFYAIRRAKRASEMASPPYRGPLIAFVIGAMALCIAIFFVDLHQPWRYFWAYAGLAMRLAVSAPATERAPAPAATRQGARNTPLVDSHGWIARARGSKSMAP